MAAEPLVRDLMTSPVTTLPPQARLLDAALLLRRSGFRHVVIAEGDQLVGIVSDRDVQRFAPSLLMKITPEEYNAIFENTQVERVMTRNPFAVSSSSPLSEAVQLLHDHKLGCLPVVDDGRLVGILTVTDALGLLSQLLNRGSAPRSLLRGPVEPRIPSGSREASSCIGQSGKSSGKHPHATIRFPIVED